MRARFPVRNEGGSVDEESGLPGPRTIAALLLPLLSYGCVASPALMVTSSAGDNVAYSETGKSMLDYALSEILDGDCTLMHGFSRGQFCRDVPESPIVEGTSAKQAKQDEKPAPTSREAELDFVFGMSRPTSATPDSDRAAPVPAAPPRVPDPPAVAGAPAEDARWAFVLGVFKDYDQATELAAKLKPNAGIVSSIVAQGEVFYRVTTRPFPLNQAAENEKPVAAIGIPDAKMVAVCPEWMRDDTCLILDRSASR
jgi:hypothetical protein